MLEANRINRADDNGRYISRSHRHRLYFSKPTRAREQIKGFAGAIVHGCQKGMELIVAIQLFAGA